MNFARKFIGFAGIASALDQHSPSALVCFFISGSVTRRYRAVLGTWRLGVRDKQQRYKDNITGLRRLFACMVWYFRGKAFVDLATWKIGEERRKCIILGLVAVELLDKARL